MVSKRAPKTREEKIAERRAEIDAIAQMQANWEAEQAERQRDHNEFAARVEAGHAAVASFIHKAWAQREDSPLPEREFYAVQHAIEQEALEQVRATVPTLDGIYSADTAARREAEAEAERARIAAIPDRDIWRSTLPPAEQDRISKWEHIKKMKYPIPLSALNAIKAARAAGTVEKE